MTVYPSRSKQKTKNKKVEQDDKIKLDSREFPVNIVIGYQRSVGDSSKLRDYTNRRSGSHSEISSLSAEN